MRVRLAAFILSFLLAGCTGQQNEGPGSGDSYPASPDTVKEVVSSDFLHAGSHERLTTSVGQLIYVPVYSHIYQQDRQQTFNLTTTLSIRNVDPFRRLVIEEVVYYDSDGNLIQHFLQNEKELGPLSSTSFVVEERDLRGGVGANFLVSWASEEPVSTPVVEAIMISTSQQQGISFLSVGRVLQEYQEGKKEGE